MSDAPPVIEAQHVSKTYASHRALDDITFTISRGECFALLGPNGAGKTTLLRILTDILKPDTGTVRILGSENLMTVKDRIGYLPEERGLYKRQKVIDILAYLAELKGLSTAGAKARAMEALQEVGMASHAQSKPEALSKGMAQRIQLAGTLVHDPEVAILDEPFSGLDPASSQEMQELLLAERARGRTLILSTHQMQPVERLCDRLLMLNRGRAVLYGSISEVRGRYRTGTLLVGYEGDLPQIAGVKAEIV
ncbi:MAG TPA: ATP-binding cassette domain-containing protein, partial [Capsulimonadaceae bacterium]|nr:ATP-binding cassette domain-containing protein [Capsulimonadaceae bacterium]